MPDEKHRQPADDDEQQPNISPSLLFLEMMREAARHAQSPESDVPDTAQDESELEAALVEEVADSDSSSSPVLDEVSAAASEVATPDGRPATVPEPPSDKDEKRKVKADAEVDEASSETGDSAARVPIYTPPTAQTSEAEHQAKLEAQRIRRIRRRKERARQRRVGFVGGFLRTIFVTFFAAALASTIFTWFTSPDFITPKVASGLQRADATSVAAIAPATPTDVPVTPNFLRRIGIVSGHHGPEHDPGAVCPDGLTEAEINFNVAQLVVQELRSRGFTVDLLDEFDPRLEGFQAAALVSLHSNDCRDYGEFGSGYLVARAAARPPGGFDDVLAECIALHYGRITGSKRNFSLTLDMTDYHTFREIHPLTPAAILEMGFMGKDRELLTERQEDIAAGIIGGIQCFLNGENPIPQLTATPMVTPTNETDGG